jgi:hypothetical protein
MAGAPVSCGEHDVQFIEHGGSSGGAGGVSGASLTFCDIAPILEAKCRRCHADPPDHGAPFPLVSYEDTHGPRSGTGDGRLVQIHEAVESGFMPYVRLVLEPPVEALTCEERTTLLEWTGHGGPPATGECSQATPRLLPCPVGSAGSAGSD